MKIDKNNILTLCAALTLVGTVAACSAQRPINIVQRQRLAATISLPDDKRDEATMRQMEVPRVIERDTIVVNVDGHEMVIMKAVRDDETGEMVATQELSAAVVTARFRNVAERHGKIDLEFQVRVPKEMAQPAWQLRFYPDMYIMGDSVRLDRILITGDEYRRAQYKGYQQYQKFLDKIISDTTKFVNIRQLEIFLMRNIPQIYAFKNDSTEVSDEQFASCFGVSEQRAIEHYTNKWAVARNNRRKMLRGKMYSKYVKAPIEAEHIRLDTVIKTMNGDFIYDYVQTITTCKGLRKVDIVLSGEIYEQDTRLYTIPPTDPLTFYISSVSTFADPSPRYRTKVIERRAEANAAWNVDFKVGKSDIDESLGRNAEMIANIKDNLRMLLSNETFDLDSVTVAAFSSPEGLVVANKRLSAERATKTVKYFGSFMKDINDSLRREAGMSVVVSDLMQEGQMTSAGTFTDISFRTSASGENWDYLTSLVRSDESLSEDEKQGYFKALDIEDLDRRENELKKNLKVYTHLKEDLYPLLRTVQFNFYLHRKGMVKDTVHTTEVDTTYMKGVGMLIDRDYEGAAALLGPYNDYNTAIAYVSLDRNVSALSILEKLKETPQVDYMLALLYSRMGDDSKAVQKYLTSCSKDRNFVFRGSLDPEIAALIKKYGLNEENEDDGDGVVGSLN